MAYLEILNLNKSFGENHVLKGIDFSMERGEVVSVIGSSGGGKTTFLRCLNFLEKPDEGQILIDGELLYDAALSYSDAEIREKRLSFGLVFQSFHLFPQYTAFENILIPLNLRAFERAAVDKLPFRQRRALKAEIMAENKVKAMELLRNVGLEAKADAYPCHLSGGQCQRVAIARALALSPAILCFDEPTSALDPELTGEVLRVIKQLKQEGRTMIIVTHEMSFARHVSDKVIFMADGVIEEMGAPEDVFDTPQSPKTQAFFSSFEEEI